MNPAVTEELLFLLQLKPVASLLPGLPPWGGSSGAWRLFRQHPLHTQHSSLSSGSRHFSYRAAPERGVQRPASDATNSITSDGGLPTKDAFRLIMLKGVDTAGPVNISRPSSQARWPQSSTPQPTVPNTTHSLPTGVSRLAQRPSPATGEQQPGPSNPPPAQNQATTSGSVVGRSRPELRVRARAMKQPVVELPQAHWALRAKYWFDERLGVVMAKINPALVLVSKGWDRVCVVALDVHTNLHAWAFLALEWLGEARHSSRQHLRALTSRLQEQLQSAWAACRQQVQRVLEPTQQRPSSDMPPPHTARPVTSQSQQAASHATTASPSSTTSNTQQPGLNMLDISAATHQPPPHTQQLGELGASGLRQEAASSGLAAAPQATASTTAMTSQPGPSQPSLSDILSGGGGGSKRAGQQVQSDPSSIPTDVLAGLLKQHIAHMEPKHLTAQLQKLKAFKVTRTLKERKIDIDNGMSPKMNMSRAAAATTLDISKSRPVAVKAPGVLSPPPLPAADHVGSQVQPGGVEGDVAGSTPQPPSPAQLRHQEVRQGLNQLVVELQELQGRIREYQQQLGASAPSSQLDVARYRPVLQLAGQVNKLQEQVKAYEDELQLIESGGWLPPQRDTQPGQVMTSGAQPPASFTSAPEPDLAAALDDLLLALDPAAAAKPHKPSRSQRTSQHQQQQRPSSAHQQSLGLRGSSAAGARDSRQQAKQAAQQQAAAAAPQVASWVDDLRDVLGGPGSHVTAAGVSQAEQQFTDDEHMVELAEHEEQHLATQEEQPTRTGSMEPLEIPALVSVRGLASLLGCHPATLDTWLREVLQESPASYEDSVSAEAAELAALEWGYTPLMHAWAHTQGPLAPRQPVVAILGHVDHGKTSLLDALRNTSVAAHEAGGITQHIGAFEVRLPGAGQPITFLDTPGHAAFSAMRARGAAVTDIVILVVAADDGVMPQTREALAHARSAGCPIVVALTKCDLPSARPDVVKAALLAEGLELEEYGGSVQVVHTSARTALGLQELQEALQLQAELMELKATNDGPAIAVVVEASQGRSGAQATVVVQQGRLRVGDPCVVGTQFGKVRALKASTGQAAGAEGVGPGQHALVLGLRGTPAPGDKLQVVVGEERARRIAEARTAKQDDYRRMQLTAALHAQRRQEARKAAGQVSDRQSAQADRMSALAQRKSQTAKQLAQMAAQGQVEESDLRSGDQVSQEADEQLDADVSPDQIKEVKLVVKADVQGSVEAVCSLAQQCSTPHVNVKVLHAGVGPLTPGDVNLALAAGAHLVTFNLGAAGVGGPATEQALSSAKQAGVSLMSHNIIYHLMDELREMVQGATPFIEAEEVVGTARVLATFPLSATSSKKAASLAPGTGRIAGLRVDEGHVQRGASKVRVIRSGQVVYEGCITSLKRHKLDVDQVGRGTECGLVVDHGEWSDWQQGDIVQCWAAVRRRADEA